MNIKPYYKTESGEIVELDDLIYHNLWYFNMIELILNEKCEYVSCWGNQLTKLILNDNCKEVYCWDNQLTEFDTNKAQIVRCDMKSLTNLNKVKELNLWI